MNNRPDQPGKTSGQRRVASPAAKGRSDEELLHALTSQAVDSIINEQGDGDDSARLGKGLQASDAPGQESDLKGVLSPEDLELLFAGKASAPPAQPSSNGRVFSDDELDTLLKQAAADAEALTASLMGVGDDHDEDGEDEPAEEPAEEPLQDEEAAPDASEAVGDPVLAEVLSGRVDASGKPFVPPVKPAAAAGPRPAEEPSDDDEAEVADDMLEEPQSEASQDEEDLGGVEDWPAESADEKSPDETLTREDLDLLLAQASQAPGPAQASEEPLAPPPATSQVGAGSEKDDAPLVMELSQLDELLASRAEHKVPDADAASDLAAAPQELVQEKPHEEVAAQEEDDVVETTLAPAAPETAPAGARPAMPPMFVKRGTSAAPAAPAADAATPEPAESEEPAAAETAPAPAEVPVATADPSALQRSLFIVLSILNRPFENVSPKKKTLAAYAAAALLMWSVFLVLLTMAAQRAHGG